MNKTSLWASALALSCAVAGSASADVAPAGVHIVLKFIKRTPSATVRLDPSSCPACVEGRDPAFARDDPREILVELTVPRERHLELAFTAPGVVPRAILETSDMPVRANGARLLVELPPLTNDRVDAGEFDTQFVETGMVVRVEHLDPQRLAGAYAGRPAPLLQRQAATNLEFAEREAARQLGLGAYVAQQRIGVIEIMGFDTNDPHGHLDAPPHIHMHLRWPFNTGTQIGHFYIGEDGRLTEDRVGISRFKLPARTFGRGDTFTTIDNQGRPVFSQTITATGGLSLVSAHEEGNAPACAIEPEGAGFHAGATVSCSASGAGAGPAVLVRASDDIVAGVLRVSTGAVTETFRYDPATGRLASPESPPPLPPASVLPSSVTSLDLPQASPSASGPNGSD